MKTMTDADKAKYVLRLIQCEVDRCTENLIQSQSELASAEVRKEWAHQLDADNLGVCPKSDAANESVRYCIESVQSCKDELQRQKEIYQFLWKIFYE